MCLPIDSIYKEYFYKYRDFKKENYSRTMDMIFKQEIYFSSINNFNDPFDCRPNFSLQCTQEELKQYYKKLWKKKRPELNRKQREYEIKKALKNSRKNTDSAINDFKSRHVEFISNNLGIFCLTKDPESILMWSHYAASHTGVCLEFCADSESPFFTSTQKVNYSNDYPTIKITELDNEKKLELALLTKSKLWVYEKEWRMFENAQGPGISKYPQGLLTGIIFGACIDPKIKNSIIDNLGVLKNRPLSYQASLEESRFGIVVNRIE